MSTITDGKGHPGKRPLLKYTALALALVACVGGGNYFWKSFIKPQENQDAQETAISPDMAPSVSDASGALVAAAPAAPAEKYNGPDTSLIKRLLPASEIRGIEKLDFGLGTYVWEIDMLADQANPQSSGFVYLSADGSKLLNGPMMDKRSKVMPLPNAADGAAEAAAPLPAPLPGMSHHTPEQVMPESSADANQEQAFNPQPALEAQAKKAAYQRDQFYAGISQLNYISTTQGSNVVYVLFDPLCAACGRLYKQSTAIAAAYDVEFRWIPIFLNEKSYPISALIQKIYNQDQAKGRETLDQILTKQWKAEDHLMEIAGLTEADYEQVKPGGSVFYEIGRAVPGIGTPFVMFKNSASKVEAFGGVPLATDWASLKKQ